MRRFQPRIAQLKERYGDDKQKFQMAMMELYKKEKINPVGGCLPVLPQMIIFMALYWVLMESVELRQAPWTLWIHDLTRSEEHTSELQSLMRISYAVFCLKTKIIHRHARSKNIRHVICTIYTLNTHTRY